MSAEVFLGAGDEPGHRRLAGVGPMRAEPAELVMRDLIDALLQEDLVEFAGAYWCRMKVPTGWVSCRVRPGGALQRYRYASGPVWYAGDGAQPRPISPEELLLLACGEFPAADDVAEDVRAAVSHTAVLLGQRDGLDLLPKAGELLVGERLAATRNRPFHPTARAASGWSTAELTRYGPMRAEPLGLDWVAVRRDRLRFGQGADSQRIPELILDPAAQRMLGDLVAHTDEFLPMPVHPWQFDHVLPTQFAAELADGAVVPLVRGLGRFHPTASIRTLTTAPETPRQVKLPLAVATLGATRLLPPRYLANAERAQQSMRELIDRDAVLSRRVALCDERIWCGWHDPADEFGNRPGQLAAQVRVYPELDGLALPMAALAAHEWDVLAPVLSERFDAVRFFRELAGAFCELGFGFLRNGVLPELHGQNVVVTLRGGTVDRFVLRDHDTLRLYPQWMKAAGTRDPRYAIKPGAPQSLHLDCAEALVGYFQTLGCQVNLYGIADALCRHFGLDERVLWSELRAAVLDCLPPLPKAVANVLRAQLLHAPTWPSRSVLGPLLRQGRAGGVSMPAGTGSVPNPLSEKVLR
ncbi:siderophore staphylobactin biosynthesis protein SbnC [Saccharopolyspora sp. K220]|uniref:IucA/IucC family protein n=1 Tax=Saccharopolyspora soli TaxID=2926618 RepID=UPI001F56D2C8|nr:IucA/IucC family protein [Saccharopolyspora soli]MCI2417286.1 siderophore staphylobactin biosynthesis protein SbnC [Saccharopolyspora soli]